MKKFWGIGKVFFLFVALLIIDTAAAVFLGKYALYVIGVSLAAGVLIAVISVLRLHSIIGKIISGVSKGISTSQSAALTSLNVPVLITSDNDEIVWYNPAFELNVADTSVVAGKIASDVFGESMADNKVFSDFVQIRYGRKMYEVTASSVDAEGLPLKLFYFFDITEYNDISEEYKATRPVVAVVALDNLDEITKNARDSEVALFRSEVQKVIEKWFSHISGICRRMSGDRYMIVTEERYYGKISGENFGILEKVRELKFGDSSATLSIGVGKGGDTLSECEDMATQALDMAFGRGGDQVVIKMPDNEYKFYGGVSGSLEKHNKVRARIISDTLKGLIVSSSNVMLMGHRFADLDSFGSCLALCSAAKMLGKEAYIVMDKTKTMAESLLNRADTLGTECEVITGDDALDRIDKQTLLIITDVHRPSFLDTPEVYNRCHNVVVIDHHRKSVDFINDAVIFYHETAVSSTCEMVTEMLQYMCPKCVGQLEAEALLSGIMLDSKNYVLNTGVRTFEASAFLRNRGADPVTVKKLFADSIDTYKLRAEIVRSAEIYDVDCAIAVHKTVSPASRIASAQAADELLGISGVLGSFVISSYGSEINISARSLGGMNVQLIMEKLGGGGHRTMAACQLKVDSFDEAVKLLINAIDEYKKEQRKN